MDRTQARLLHTNGAFDIDKAYWKQRFMGEAAGNGFPPAFLPDGGNEPWRAVSAVFPAEVQRELLRISNGSALGLYTLLVSGVHYLLNRYTLADDVATAAPVFRSNTGELPAYNNVVVIKSRVKAEWTWVEYLGYLKKTVTEALLHQQAPFELVMEELGIPVLRGQHPYLQTMVALESIHNRLDGVGVRPDLLFTFAVRGETLRVQAEYVPQLYDEAGVQRILGHLSRFFEEVTVHPNRPLSAVNLLGPEERSLILDRFNDTQSAQPVNQPAHVIFEHQVRQNPDASAVLFADAKRTRAQVNGMANSLARYLRGACGVQNGSRVGLIMERNAEIVTAIYGVLKADAACVMLDLIFPEERVRAILEDSEVSVVLTTRRQRALVERIRETLPGLQAIEADDPEGAWNRYDSSNLNLNVDLASTAFLVYTSGSTGKPKGVEIGHLVISNLTQHCTSACCFTSGQVLLALSAVSFDMFLLDTVGALGTGMSVVIASEEEMRDPRAFAQVVKRHGIQVFQATPTRMQMFLDEPAVRPVLKEIEVIVLAGEEFPRTLLAQLQHGTRAQLINAYGPTETSYSTIQNATHAERITIGFPIANYRCYVMDANQQLQPVGVIGELCIGGHGVARGYLHLSEQTAARFLLDPHNPGQRMYRTGDLARWLPSGEIEYLGRIDRQVKIRGYRIEIDEIEARLQSFPPIVGCAVVPQEDERGKKELTAFFVAERLLTAREIYTYLEPHLPPYMIPARFMQLDYFPLTTSGKKDRKALAAMEVTDQPAHSLYEPARNEREQRVIDVWEEVLGRSPVGIHDQFFALGGNSLKAIQVVALLGKDFIININDLFELTDLAALAARIEYNPNNLADVINDLRTNAHEYEGPEAQQRLVKCLADYRTALKISCPQPYFERKTYGKLLLTGATGFLGSHLLQELFVNTSAHLVLLLRGDTIGEAVSRLRIRYEHYFGVGSLEELLPRVTVVLGDLAKPGLGVTESVLRELADTVDGIINAAANLKHFGRQEELFAVNVHGLSELLDLAQTGRRKDVHHISTTSVGTGRPEPLFSELDTDLANGLDNPFLLSKIEGERLIYAAREAGISATLYRLSSLFVNTATGKFQYNLQENGFFRFLKALVSLGVVPALESKTLDFSCVDHVAAAFGKLFDKPALHNKNHHLFAPNKISWAETGVLLAKAGWPVEIVTYKDFLDRLQARFDNPDERSAITTILLQSFLLRNSPDSGFLRINERTSLLLEDLGMTWPEFDGRHLAELMHLV